VLTYPGDDLAPLWPDGAEPSAALPVALPDTLLVPAPAPAPAVESVPGTVPARRPPRQAEPVRQPAAVPGRRSAPTGRKQPKPERVFVEPKGCLFALSQPPLMLFLCVIGGLLGGGAVWDLLFV
jgi:hypothetical protein